MTNPASPTFAVIGGGPTARSRIAGLRSPAWPFDTRVVSAAATRRGGELAAALATREVAA